jgi:hypothetical protein
LGFSLAGEEILLKLSSSTHSSKCGRKFRIFETTTGTTTSKKEVKAEGIEVRTGTLRET